MNYTVIAGAVGKLSANVLEGRKEGNVLFNDAPNTFYLRLYGVRKMVKDHSDSERGRKEGNVLFNDALNTFYLLLYGVRKMVKDHSDSERGRKEGNVLFNDAPNTFYLLLYGVRKMVKDHSDSERGRKEMFYLTTHSTHFIYGYMASYGKGQIIQRERKPAAATWTTLSD